MWQAKLVAVNNDLGKTVDALTLSVELFHTDGRITAKKYIVYLDELTEVTAASLKAPIQTDLDRLNKLDQVMGVLQSKIGKVI
jgi:hypothetical protein